MYVDGPILDVAKYKSGVGALPIPVVHGLTMGEIALMAQGEGWSKKCDVEVVPCAGYTHQSRYVLPIAPSPNLPTQHSIYLYPSTCLFEGVQSELMLFDSSAPAQIKLHASQEALNKLKKEIFILNQTIEYEE